MAGGGFHSLAMNEFGHVYSWGKKTAGQLGLEYNPVKKKSDIHAFEALPQQVAFPVGTARIARITASGDTSFALTDDKQLFAWGSNGNSQVGQPSGELEEIHRPMKVEFPGEEGNVNVLDVDSGGEFTLMLLE